MGHVYTGGGEERAVTLTSCRWGSSSCRALTARTPGAPRSWRPSPRRVSSSPLWSGRPLWSGSPGSLCPLWSEKPPINSFLALLSLLVPPPARSCHPAGPSNHTPGFHRLGVPPVSSPFLGRSLPRIWLRGRVAVLRVPTTSRRRDLEIGSPWESVSSLNLGLNDVGTIAARLLLLTSSEKGPRFEI